MCWLIHRLRGCSLPMLCLFALLGCWGATGRQAWAVDAVINNAAPGTGVAPLAVSFDSTGSSTGDQIKYLWTFGDGAISSAPFPIHIFNTAGTYDVSLQVSDGSATDTAQIQILVTGSGEGPLTANMNFRWAPNFARFTLNHAAAKRDSMYLTATFSTVDLPPLLNDLFLEFRINDTFLITGNLDHDGLYLQSPGKFRPGFQFRLNRKTQTLSIQLQQAELADALAASTPPMLDADVPKLPETISQTTLRLTLGSQSYQVTLGLQYSSTQGNTGNARFRLTGNLGELVEGFWVIQEASALENTKGTGHFFEFSGVLARPAGERFTVPPQAPNSGFWRVQIGDYVDTIPADRFRYGDTATKIVMNQPERERGGVRLIVLDMHKFTILVRTWDVRAEGSSGTGLPLKGDNRTGFNMVFRLDFQPDTTLPDTWFFQAVTASRMTRRGSADALWQTGRGSG